MEFGRQGFHQLVFGNAQRLRAAAQRLFRHDLVFAFAQEQTDGRAVLQVLHLGIHRREVKNSTARDASA